MANCEKTCEGLEALFKKYAGDNDSISEAEFKKMIEDNVNNAEIRAKILESDCFKAIDRNNDGGISFPEFAKFCQFMAKCKQMMETGKCDGL